MKQHSAFSAPAHGTRRPTASVRIVLALLVLAILILSSDRLAAAGYGTAILVQSSAETCRQLLINGDFEAPNGWTLAETARPAVVTSEQVHGGRYSLRLGIPEEMGNAASYSTAYQWITLPANAATITLRARLWHANRDPEQDSQFLWVTAPDSNYTVFWDKADARQWETVEYDLTPLQGQQVRIFFGVYNNGRAGKALMYVDDVEVEACEPSASESPQTPALPDAGVGETETPAPAEDGTHLPVTSDEDTSPMETPIETPLDIPAVACRQLLANGDFERNGDWARPDAALRATMGREVVLSGERSLRLGLPPDSPNQASYSTAYQWITLPADAQQITLRAAVWRDSGEADGDLQFIWVGVDNRYQKVLQGLVADRTWQRATANLTPLRGKRVRIMLGTYNDGGGGRTLMYVDDVSVEACAGAAPSATEPTLPPATAEPAPTEEAVLPATPEPAETPPAATTEPVATAVPSPTTPPLATPQPTPISTQKPAPEAGMRSPDFGAQAFLWWRPEIADRDLKLLREAGFHWVRQTFAWEDIQRTDSEDFYWEYADRVVQEVNASGLKLLARLGSDPNLGDFWAGHPPENGAAFADFAFAMASRYDCTPQAAGCIQAYQIWNEPNLAREWGGKRPNPAQYAAFLGRAYRAIKQANPTAIVISAGLAPTGTDNAMTMPDERFYRGMYSFMAGDSDGYFDMLGVHAAGFAAPPELDPAEVAANARYGGHRFFAFRHVEDIRAIMVANGDDDKRIAVLEFGWTSDPVNPDYAWHGAGAGIDEFVKADYLVRAYRYGQEHWQPWIGVMSLLTMPNLDWLSDGVPEDEEQYWWAIMEPSPIDQLRLRPAFVELCIFFNGLNGQSCPYAPEP